MNHPKVASECAGHHTDMRALKALPCLASVAYLFTNYAEIAFASIPESNIVITLPQRDLTLN